jgi:glutathione synthase
MKKKELIFFMSKKTKIVAIQGDKLKTINKDTDTSLLLALEAQRRGYKIYYYETENLNYINGKVQAYIKELKLFEKNKKFYKIINQKFFDLSKANYVLIRQNPPFNMDYITATFFLEQLPKNVKVINNPVSVRNVSEKFYSVNFLKYMPPTIFTKNIEEIKKFVKKYKKIVIKPIHGYGGKNILFVNKSINQIKVLNYIKKFGHIMVQKFIPEVTKGDKRVFIINGLVKGAIQRVPRKGSFVSNLAQGGKAIETKLNYKELKISKIVAKHLKKSKIFFAGIDLVSNYLIGDINVTSPTGLKNFKDLTGINLAEDFWNNLEKLK